MTFEQIKSFLNAHKRSITNPGNKKLSGILGELVDAITTANTAAAGVVENVKAVYGFPLFSAETAYVEKDLVVYNNKLYKCKAGGHSIGAWNAEHFDETTLVAEVVTLLKA